MPTYAARMRRKFRRQQEAEKACKKVTAANGRDIGAGGQTLAQSQPAGTKAISGAETVPQAQIVPGGSGGPLSDVLESETVGDARLRSNAVRRGWIKPGDNDDWPLKIRQSDIDRMKEASGDDLALDEQITAAVMRDLNAPGARIRQFAVKAGLAMKAQNMASRHHDERMDHHERVLESRGGLSQGEGASDDECVVIVIPHNDRDPAPPGAIMGSFEDYRGKTKVEDEQ